MKQAKEWYVIDNIDEVDSPALVLYPERINENIRQAMRMAGNVHRLRPHVKTNKCRETMELMTGRGIYKFKCATIPEAETLAMCNAKDVLLAYQPVAPRLERLISLIKEYPSTKFSCLVDNKASARLISEACRNANVQLSVYIDLDLGMHRTGIAPGEATLELYAYCAEQSNIQPVGLHAYDGHIRNPDINDRTIACNDAFAGVIKLKELIVSRELPEPIIIAGGSPTFPIHALREGVECSPGTFIYWDHGYATMCPEQPFLPAAVLVTRVISTPGHTRICLDLGHKGVAAENPLSSRAHFLNAQGLVPVSQSEEHLVMEAGPNHGYNVGDVLYALPFHVCPTVALYERAYVAENNRITGEWKTIARDRKLVY
ncbi:MAG TPA: D-TA family PLP-dependent enzyme [Chitinophagaceae bacterium]|nr:D-TA family PLP-dependent enzyme [Chitinophagaceae bacterium]